jgi:hypothetical protein
MLGLFPRNRPLSFQANIIYSRETESVALAAIKGKTEYPTEKHGASIIEVTDADFLIDAAELTLGGVKIEPQRGDRIEEIDADGKRTAYTVFNLPNERCFRETAGMLGIHTKKE